MDWQPVVAKGGRSSFKKGRRTPEGNRNLSEEEVKALLAIFKTKPCEREEHHDHRICSSFHNAEKDYRRNPYKEYYSIDECRTPFERMYHPAVFRTTFCRHGASCLFGSICAHAHTTEDLRDRVVVSQDYETMPVQKRQHPVLSSFIPDEEQRRESRHAACRAIWSELEMQPTSKFLALNSMQHFLICRSKFLFDAIRDAASEEGLALVSKELRCGKEGLVIKGLHVETTEQKIRAMLSPPSPHFVVAERGYGERVVSSLHELLWKDNGSLAVSEDVFIQIRDDPCGVSVTGLNLRSVEEVLGRIDFWVSREGYDRFTECGCCGEERNLDQGVACSNGHFYCAVEESDSHCLAMAISSQVHQIRSREEPLVCPNCEVPYDRQVIARHLPKSVWDEVEKAIIDKKVEKNTESLARDFDRRLEEKVQELMSKYIDADVRLRAEAQREALKVRNTVLNLSCPHCGIAYAEFAGCMALTCSSCKESFCGYCHQKCQTSRGAHEHVRQCLMNETTNGSYYASEEEIERAHRRYRTRALKKYLREFKKDLQNAIVIELEKDLDDLGIQPAALFEFGNLQGDLLD